MTSNSSINFQKEVAYILREILVNPNQLCWLVAENCGTPNLDYFFPPNWTIEIPAKTNLVNKSESGGKNLRILHLSDVHHDLKYMEGAEANCSLPVCCRQPPQKNDYGNLTVMF